MCGTKKYFESCVVCDKDIDVENTKRRRWSYNSDTGEYTCEYCNYKKKSYCDYCEQYKKDTRQSPYPGDEEFKICPGCWKNANHSYDLRENDLGGFDEISYWGRSEDE